MNALPGEGSTPPEEFARALRTAIRDRGLSLERIRYHLKEHGHHLSAATLSYWQSGRSRPDRASSLAALGTLEEVLQVPRGSLAAHLPGRAPRTGGRSTASSMASALFDSGGLIDRDVTSLGIVWGDLERVAIHDLVTVAEDRTTRSHELRKILRAARDGVDRFAAVHFVEPSETLTILPRRGCHLGRVIHHPDHGVAIAELLLDQPLMTHDVALIEYAHTVTGATQPTKGWERGCVGQLREIHMEVEFPEQRPRSTRAAVITDGQERPAPVTLHGALLSLLLLDVGPGVIGLSWSW